MRSYFLILPFLNLAFTAFPVYSLTVMLTLLFPVSSLSQTKRKIRFEIQRPPDNTLPGLPNRECLEFIKAVEKDLGLERSISVIGPRLLIANSQEIQVHTKDKTTIVSGQRACEHPEVGGADQAIGEILAELHRRRQNQSAEEANKGSGHTDYYLRKAAENCAKLGEKSQIAGKTIFPNLVPASLESSPDKLKNGTLSQ